MKNKCAYCRFTGIQLELGLIYVRQVLYDAAFAAAKSASLDGETRAAPRGLRREAENPMTTRHVAAHGGDPGKTRSNEMGIRGAMIEIRQVAALKRYYDVIVRRRPAARVPRPTELRAGTVQTQ